MAKQINDKDSIARLGEIEEKGASERSKLASFLLGVAFAILGFQFKYLIDGNYDPVTNDMSMIYFLRLIFITSLLLTVASVFFGLISNFIVILSLRYDAILLKKKMNKESTKSIESFEESTKKGRENAWTFFALQIAMFSLSTLFFSVFYFWRYMV